MSPKPRIMAIDYGTKRVGVASTDVSGEFALPRGVWPNDKDLIDKVLNLAREEGSDLVVIGEPKNLNMGENPIFKKIQKFKQELESRGVKTVFHPELYTTIEARRIQGNTDLTDSSAAALILKSYIENDPPAGGNRL